MKIALDAMGGDSAPACTVAGAWEALKKYPDIEIVLVGDEARIEQELRSLDAWPMDKRFSILHASQVVAMSDSATDVKRAPLLGEHTDEVLAELGYGAQDITTLRAQKVI